MKLISLLQERTCLWPGRCNRNSGDNYEENIVGTIAIIAAGAGHSNSRRRPKNGQTSDNKRTYQESRGKARSPIKSPRDDHAQRWRESKGICLQRRRWRLRDPRSKNRRVHQHSLCGREKDWWQPRPLSGAEYFDAVGIGVAVTLTAVYLAILRNERWVFSVPRLRASAAAHCEKPNVPGLGQNSETDSRAELKRSWTAWAEDLTEARAGLTERGRVGDVAAVLDQVGGVEEIEDFAYQDKTYSLASKRKRAAQAQVLGEEVVVEGIVGGQRQTRSEWVASSRFAGELLVILRHQQSQVGFAEAAIELIYSCPRQQIVLCPVPVEISSAYIDLERRPAISRDAERDLKFPGQVDEAGEIQNVTPVRGQRAIAFEPVEVIESGTRKLYTAGAVGSRVTTKCIRSQELCPTREALFQTHKQPLVLRDAGRVIERDRPVGTDCGHVL